MGSHTNKVLGLVIMICVLGIVGTMTLLGSNGSLIIAAIMVSLKDWAPLIGLGVGLGIFFYFMPSKKARTF